MNRFLLVLLVINSFFVKAQGTREVSYGVFLGANYSKISALPDVIIPKGVYTDYSLKTEGKFGPSGGLFINWKYPYAKLSIQSEISYASQKTNLNYQDAKDLRYDIAFNYNYLNLGAQVKYYPFENFYVGIGPSIGFNISQNAIEYSSNGQELAASTGAFFEPDATVENVLKEALLGKNHFFANFSIGYEFPSNISVGARYSLGISDVVETQENGFRYIENKNKLNSYALYVSYSFDFEGLKNF